MPCGSDLIEGFRYVRNRPRVSALLTLSAVNSLFGAPYFSMVPIYARDIFRLGETGLAVMMGTSGGGAFLGALLVAYLGDFRRKGLVCAWWSGSLWFVHHRFRTFLEADSVAHLPVRSRFRSGRFSSNHQHATSKARH